MPQRAPFCSPPHPTFAYSLSQTKNGNRQFPSLVWVVYNIHIVKVASSGWNYTIVKKCRQFSFSLSELEGKYRVAFKAYWELF